MKYNDIFKILIKGWWMFKSYLSDKNACFSNNFKIKAAFSCINTDNFKVVTCFKQSLDAKNE